MVTVLITHSDAAYLLFESPSFTAAGISSLVILFDEPSQTPLLSYLAVYLSLPSVNVAWKFASLSDQLTFVAVGYLVLKLSVTTAGIGLNCASTCPAVRKNPKNNSR